MRHYFPGIQVRRKAPGIQTTLRLLLAAITLLPLSQALAQCRLSPEAFRLAQEASLSRASAERDTTYCGSTYSHNTVAAFVALQDEAGLDLTDVGAQLAEMGIQVQTSLPGWLTVRLPAAALSALARLPFVRYVSLAATPQPALDVARADGGVDLSQSGSGLSRPYTGQGVVVGIVDAGFDYTHPNFLGADGLTCRISRVWEQGTATGNPPAGFTYGTELTQPADIRAAAGDVAGNSHGTHVAGIAAGSGAGTAWSGVAPEAEIVLVAKGGVTPDNVNIVDAITYIYRYAESVGRPCVVNLSLGMQMGPHDGTSPFDQMTDALQGPGRLLVGSAGNFGAAKLHVGRTFAGGEEGQPLATMVSFAEKPDANHPGGDIDVWGAAGTNFRLQLQLLNYATGQVAYESEIIAVGADETQSHDVTLAGNAKGTIAVTTERNPLNGKPHARLHLALTSLRTKYAVALVLTPQAAGRIDAWTDGTALTFTDNGLEGYTDGDTHCTLAEIGGTGSRIITTGAYATRCEYTTEGSTLPDVTAETLHALATFSSTGPTVDGRMKPDVAAPGTYIISSLSSHDASATAPVAGSVSHDGRLYTFGYMQGTSMAAPYMTGVAALWLQADATLSPADVRRLLSESSTTDAFTQPIGSDGGHWGYGKVNAHAGLSLLQSQESGIGLTDSGAQGGGAGRVQFLCGAQGGSWTVRFHAGRARTVRVEVIDIAGRTVLRRSVAVPTGGEEITLDAAQLSPGTYILSAEDAGRSDAIRLLRR